MNLSVVNNQEEIKTVDSREVAEMMGKTHSELMKDIKGSGKNKGIMPILEKGKFSLSEYFIESTYKTEGNNKTYNCFLITKMGCEILGNKLQGEKGILFTASYVRRFNEMEKVIQNNVLSFQIEDPIERAKAWILEQEKAKLLLTQKDEIIDELSPLAEIARNRIDKTGTVSLTDVTKSFGLKKGQVSVWAKTNGFIHKSLIEVNAKGEEYFRIVCTDGEHKGIGITEAGIKFIDKNLEEVKESPCRYIRESR